MFLDQLLEIENDKELYNYKFLYFDTLMYPFIRFDLLQRAIDEHSETTDISRAKKINFLETVNYLYKSVAFRPKRKIHAPILFFGGDVANIKTGDAYFNRLNELFANTFADNSILIENSYNYSYKRPRTFAKVYANDYIKLRANLKSKFSKTNKIDLEQIDSFISYLKNRFNYKFKSEGIWNELKTTLQLYAKRLKYLTNEYIRLFQKINPKIILLQCACYGEMPIILAARYLNIKIVEYQHGLISLSHPAYNYSNKISKSYIKYLPDTFLTYGKYWSENLRIPTRIIEIGNPFLEQTLRLSKKVEKLDQILYASSVMNPKKIVQDVLLLNDTLKKHKISVVFRPHPSEHERLSNIYKPICDAGIKIDKAPIYETLAKSKFVISEFSTIMFEAIPFDCVIFTINSPLSQMYDIKIFKLVDNMEDVVKNILSETIKKYESDFFWTKGWQDNYIRFIKSEIPNIENNTDEESN